MSEYTKGPWHYQEASDAYTHIVRGPNDEFILSAPQGTSGECEANARLAAASHELLEALKAVIPSLNQLPGTDYHRLAPIVHAAIAKARRTT